jgi:hypothetical protein
MCMLVRVPSVVQETERWSRVVMLLFCMLCSRLDDIWVECTDKTTTQSEFLSTKNKATWQWRNNAISVQPGARLWSQRVSNVSNTSRSIAVIQRPDTGYHPSSINTPGQRPRMHAKKSKSIASCRQRNTTIRPSLWPDTNNPRASFSPPDHPYSMLPVQQTLHVYLPTALSDPWSRLSKSPIAEFSFLSWII